MRLLATHEFEAPLASLLATFEDRDYLRGLTASHSFFAEAEVLALDATAARVTRRVRYRARPFLARLGPLSPPAEWFGWVEHSVLERARGLLHFENVSEVDSVRSSFVNRGTMQFRARQNEHGAVVTTREATFELELRVSRGYAALSEAVLALIASQVERSLDEEARFLARYLDRGLGTFGTWAAAT